jgi:hypothetical protein
VTTFIERQAHVVWGFVVMLSHFKKANLEQIWLDTYNDELSEVQVRKRKPIVLWHITWEAVSQ